MLNKSICEMQVGETGYTMDWAIGWPPSPYVANGLNLVYEITSEPLGTSNVSIRRTSRGFIVGKGFWRKRFYSASTAQIQAAKEITEKRRESYKQWLKSHRGFKKEERKEVTEMDCSKFCANFKPKLNLPFPDTLRTADLHTGMLVVDNRGSYMVILEEPSAKKVQVLHFGKGIGYGGHAYETEDFLSDRGCQPYDSGKWNETNWLKEVKL